MSVFHQITTTSLTKDQIEESWLTKRQIRDSLLRDVQKSALYSCLAYENSHDNQPIIICMPTGTGKTGVIGSLLFKGDLKKTLIIVPNDALRTQISGDLINISKYSRWLVIPETAAPPIVFTMNKTLQTDASLDPINDCHVVVATAQSLMGSTSEQLEALINQFDRIVFDEAHHTEALKWQNIRQIAKNNNAKIHQFTATPYRLDEQRIEGKMAFRYPLNQAYRDGYFSKIEFIPVQEYYEDKFDEVIARKALAVLEQDIANGLDHLLMVRTSTIDKAKKLKELYSSLTTRSVELVTSKISATKNDECIAQLKALTLRIIICVDMLGEGFDLPQLKICALHGHRKTLPKFVQLIGRFTRVNVEARLGTAKIIANTVDENISDIFNDLYKLDADWNHLIDGLHEYKIKNEFFGSQIAEGIKDDTIKSLVSGNTLRIKCSAQACNYLNSLDDLMGDQKFNKYFTKNFDSFLIEYIEESNLIIVATNKLSNPVWGQSSKINDSIWNIFLIFKYENTLFIHADDKDLSNQLLSYCELQQTSGDVLFRLFADLDLAVYANVGLVNSDVNLNYIMYTGADIYSALTSMDKAKTYLSNIFGHGYVSGIKSSIGCSRKGIFWSMSTVKISEWIDWCQHSIRKINDQTIDVGKITDGMMKVSKVENLNDLNIIAVSSYKVFKKHTDYIRAKIRLESGVFIQSEFGEFSFQSQEGNKLTFSLKLYFGESYGEVDLSYSWGVVDGFKHLSTINPRRYSLSFGSYDDPVALIKKLDIAAWTTNFEFIILNEKLIFAPNLDFELNPANISLIDWTGVDIHSESWDYGNKPESVQAKVIELITANNPQILFYDDGSNELADLVEINADDANNILSISLYHCKYAIGSSGTTIGSVTELVQQSISSITRLSDLKKALATLKKRENLASKKGKTRFVNGNGELKDLDAVIKKLNNYTKIIKVYMVQPSLSNQALNDRVRTNLSSVSSMLKKTVNAETYFYIST